MKRFAVQFNTQGGLPSSMDLLTDEPKDMGDIYNSIRNPDCYTVQVWDNHKEKHIGYASATDKKAIENVFKNAKFIDKLK